MERNSLHNILRGQLEHDRRMRTLAHLHSLLAQGAKGLGVLNAGAVLAVLAFVQALVEKPAYPAFKPYAVNALAFFLLGSFLAAIIFFFYRKYLVYEFHDSNRKALWHQVAWALLIASAGCELAGASLITVGIYNAV